jgi:hypothetical protein
MNLNSQHQRIPLKQLGRLMRMLTLCPHANAGWPIRCSGEAQPSQHCYDCGAQRTYFLQPTMLRGPWRHPQMGRIHAVEVAEARFVATPVLQPA